MQLIMALLAYGSHICCIDIDANNAMMVNMPKHGIKIFLSNRYIYTEVNDAVLGLGILFFEHIRTFSNYLNIRYLNQRSNSMQTQ